MLTIKLQTAAEIVLTLALVGTGISVQMDPMRAAEQLAAVAKGQPTPAQPATPAEQFQTLAKEFGELVRATGTESAKAKTDEEKQKVLDNIFARMDKVGRQILELAQKNLKEPFAVDALIWVAQNAMDQKAQNAIAILARDHLEDQRVGAIAFHLALSPAPEAEKLLRTILEKNPDRKVQAQACLSLAQRLNFESRLAHSSDTKEAEKYFELTIQKYGDFKNHVADAKNALFAIRNLAIGKPAPEIEGKDTDGKEFKLTDYRGKVLLLDFWGNW